VSSTCQCLEVKLIDIKCQDQYRHHSTPPTSDASPPDWCHFPAPTTSNTSFRVSIIHSQNKATQPSYAAAFIRTTNQMQQINRQTKQPDTNIQVQYRLKMPHLKSQIWMAICWRILCFNQKTVDCMAWPSIWNVDRLSCKLAYLLLLIWGMFTPIVVFLCLFASKLRDWPPLVT